MSFLLAACSRHNPDSKPFTDSEIRQLIVGSWLLDRTTQRAIIEGSAVYMPEGRYSEYCKWVHYGTQNVSVVEGKYEVKDGYLLQSITKMKDLPTGYSPPAVITESKILHLDNYRLVLSNDSAMVSLARLKTSTN